MIWNRFIILLLKLYDLIPCIADYWVKKKMNLRLYWRRKWYELLGLLSVWSIKIFTTTLHKVCTLHPVMTFIPTSIMVFIDIATVIFSIMLFLRFQVLGGCFGRVSGNRGNAFTFMEIFIWKGKKAGNNGVMLEQGV